MSLTKLNETIPYWLNTHYYAIWCYLNESNRNLTLRILHICNLHFYISLVIIQFVFKNADLFYSAKYSSLPLTRSSMSTAYSKNITDENVIYIGKCYMQIEKFFQAANQSPHYAVVFHHVFSISQFSDVPRKVTGARVQHAALCTSKHLLTVPTNSVNEIKLFAYDTTTEAPSLGGVMKKLFGNVMIG